MTGLSLGSYLLSKILALGVLCLVQSALIVGVFAAGFLVLTRIAFGTVKKENG